MECIAFFNDLFTYQHHFNQQLVNQLEEHQDQLNDRPLDLLSHVLNAHQIWNARIGHGTPLPVHEVHPLGACRELDRSNYEASLRILQEHPPDEEVTYANSKGKLFVNTVQQILFHIVNHTTHHRGQIVAELRRQGVAPIVTDYIFYKR